MKNVCGWNNFRSWNFETLKLFHGEIFLGQTVLRTWTLSIGKLYSINLFHKLFDYFFSSSKVSVACVSKFHNLLSRKLFSKFELYRSELFSAKLFLVLRTLHVESFHNKFILTQLFLLAEQSFVKDDSKTLKLSRFGAKNYFCDSKLSRLGVIFSAELFFFRILNLPPPKFSFVLSGSLESLCWSKFIL